RASQCQLGHRRFGSQRSTPGLLQGGERIRGELLRLHSKRLECLRRQRAAPHPPSRQQWPTPATVTVFELGTVDPRNAVTLNFTAPLAHPHALNESVSVLPGGGPRSTHAAGETATNECSQNQIGGCNHME